MNNANENNANACVLPAQRYYKSLPYPQTIAERNAVAKAMAKYADCKLTGDELFPEDFPYRGANN